MKKSNPTEKNLTLVISTRKLVSPKPTPSRVSSSLRICFFVCVRVGGVERVACERARRG